MDKTNATIWKAVLGELEVVLSQANYGTWLKGTRLDSVKDGVATVYVPNILIAIGLLANTTNKS